MNDVRIRSISSQIRLRESCLAELRSYFLRMEWIAQGCEGGVDDLMHKPFRMFDSAEGVANDAKRRANIYCAYTRCQ